MRSTRPIGLFALFVLALLFPFWSDAPTTSIAIFTLIYATAAVAWNMFSGFTGYFSLGSAAYYGLGAYILGILCQDWHIPGGGVPLLLLPLVGLATGALACPLGWVALRTRRHTFMVMSIAIFFLFQVLAYNLPMSGGSGGLFLPNPPWAAQVFELPFYYVACGGLLLAFGTSWWIRHSKYGLGLLAIRDDEDRALGLGVQTGRFKLVAYMLSAFFLGLAGALSAYYVGVIYPPTAFDPANNVIIIAMVLLGGLGTLAGPLLGAALLTPLQQWLTEQFSALPGLNLVTYGFLLLVVVLGLPGGILPAMRGRWLSTWPRIEAWRAFARLRAHIRFPHRLIPARSLGILGASTAHQAYSTLPVMRTANSHAQKSYHPDARILPVSLLAEEDHQRLSLPVGSASKTASIRFDPAAHAIQFTLQIDPTRGLVIIAAAGEDAAAPSSVPSPRLLPREEWQRVLIEWNKTATPYPNRCVHHLFEEQAAQHPAATAVVCSWQAQSYQALDQDANRLAHYLLMLEVEPETLVAICMERSLELVMSVLAVLKAGCTFLLLDPQQPPDQLSRLLEHSGASLILTQAALARNLAGACAGRSLVRVDTGWQTAIAGLPAHSPRVPVTPGHTACVVMKEGSSDTLVRLSHQGLVNLHIAQRQVFALRPPDRILQFADPHSAAFLFEMVMALLVGATLVLEPQPQGRVSTQELQQLLAEEQITIAVLEQARWESLSAEALPRLRIVLSWALSPSLEEIVGRWLAPGRRVLTLYGAAETTCWATAAEWGSYGHPPSLLGRPIANKQIYVLNQDMRPVAIGERGQIYIGGVGLGHYHRRHELNLQCFPPDPFHTDPAATLYRTGQIGRWRQDGMLELLETVPATEVYTGSSPSTT